VPTPPPRLLIADDQRDVLEALRLLLKADGYLIDVVESPAAVVTALAEREYDAVLIDLNYARDTTSGAEGLDLLRQIQQLDASLPVVVMTAWGSVNLAVEAMRRGARDFVEKPWNNERLQAIIRTQVELGRAIRRADRLEAHTRAGDDGVGGLIADASSMQPVLQIIARVGPSDANVLITGENGTGKSLVARALHGVSPRASRPMVTINAGGVSEGVFESELFGHVKGAFTDARQDRVGRFELADGSSLFLDEIANVPLGQQQKLLRVLETGEFERLGSSRTRRGDVRLISATNADLHAEVAAGRFRQDLLFRLNTVEIDLPPLRERREDIAPIAAHFIAQYARKYGKPARALPADVAGALEGYDWPGNVRALRHACERAVILADGDAFTSADFSLSRGLAPSRAAPAPAPAAAPRDDLNLDRAEKQLVEEALKKHSYNISLAAAELGLTRASLYRRMEKHGL